MKGLFKLLVFMMMVSSCANESTSEAKCSAGECDGWNQGGITMETGNIVMLQSSLVLLSSDGNRGNDMSVMTKVNKYHSGYHLHFYMTLLNEINLKESIKIKLMNNKGESIYLNNDKTSLVKNGSIVKYATFISQKDKGKVEVVNDSMIRKIEVINSDTNESLYYFIPSFSETLKLKKMFCCAISLKNDVVGSE